MVYCNPLYQTTNQGLIFFPSQGAEKDKQSATCDLYHSITHLGDKLEKLKDEKWWTQRKNACGGCTKDFLGSDEIWVGNAGILQKFVNLVLEKDFHQSSPFQKALLGLRIFFSLATTSSSAAYQELPTKPSTGRTSFSWKKNKGIHEAVKQNLVGGFNPL